MFEHDPKALAGIAAVAIEQAREKGASACAVDVSENSGLSVNVRRGRVETIEQTRDKGLGVSVYFGTRRGHASTSDFSFDAVVEAVRAACDIARYTAEDPFAGLPDPDMLARDWQDPQVFYPWKIQADEAVELASTAEAAAFATSPLIRNSEGASVSVGHGQFVAANSLGFSGGYRYSRHSLGVAPIARRGRDMQRDDWYSSHSNPRKLADPAALGRYAAERALSRLGARRLTTRKVPVLFEAPLACGLLGHFVHATSGGALYRKTSFLLDTLGHAVFPDHVDVIEDPTLRAEAGSSPFDHEGVATRKRLVVEAGILKGYFLSTYSARKLGMQTTGNAGGSHNLRIVSHRTKRRDSLEAMLARMGTGLLVTDLLGQGVNYVTGDYSRGASGFWVENGRIAWPVEEITIAGNLRQMFHDIEAIGADEIIRGNKRSGSVLISEMSVAGS
jgi:PmbA protein